MITLTEGDKAPAFKSKDQNGKAISLSDFKFNFISLLICMMNFEYVFFKIEFEEMISKIEVNFSSILLSKNACGNGMFRMSEKSFI